MVKDQVGPELRDADDPKDIETQWHRKRGHALREERRVRGGITLLAAVQPLLTRRAFITSSDFHPSRIPSGCAAITDPRGPSDNPSGYSAITDPEGLYAPAVAFLAAMQP